MSTTSNKTSAAMKWVVRASAAILVILLVVIAIVLYGVPYLNSQNGAAALSAKPSPTASADPDHCEASWPMETSDYANNRWFSDGIAEIKSASTPKEAAKAAHVWLTGVRKDANLLAGAVKYFQNKDVDKMALTDKDGCASASAVDLVIQLDLLISNAQSIVPDQAPTNGYNSGVNDGNVVGAPGPGIGGDRTAIKITLPDGTEIWIMARCGNLVTSTPPPVPPGQTDECPWNPKLPPDSPECLQPKSPNKEDYVLPTEKPQQPTVTTIAESTPSPVVTTQNGGGGVIDTSSGLPGSETGTTSPGAPPAPTTPSTPPVKEGGTGNTGDTGGF